MSGSPFAEENICYSFQSEDLLIVIGQTIIQRAERSEKQRGQVRFWDLEKLFNPLSRGVDGSIVGGEFEPIKNGPHVQLDGILYQERTTWTRSVGTKNQYSWRVGWGRPLKDKVVFSSVRRILAPKLTVVFGQRFCPGAPTE